jgi:DNA-binding NarL/FixJ family response regulator
MTPYRIILADDHAMMRDGIKTLIQATPGLKVIGEAGDGFELLKVLKTKVPDLIILDVAMPGLRGIEAAHKIRAHYPTVAILFLSMHKSREYLSMAIEAGAKGYLLKENTGAELLVAIDQIRNGKTYLSPFLAQEFSIDLIDICHSATQIQADPLTKREREVLKLIAEGNTSRQIGELLFISQRTVDRHRSNIKKKLNLHRTADLVKYALKRDYTTNRS